MYVTANHTSWNMYLANHSRVVDYSRVLLRHGFFALFSLLEDALIQASSPTRYIAWSLNYVQNSVLKPVFYRVFAR